MKTFIKITELLADVRMWILIPILVIGYLLWASSDHILEKFGVHTKGYYRAELVKTQTALELARSELKKEKELKEVGKQICTIKDGVITDFTLADKEVDDIIKEFLNDLSTKPIDLPKIDFKIKPTLDEDPVEAIVDNLNTTLDPPRNTQNITSIHLAYNNLFGA